MDIQLTIIMSLKQLIQTDFFLPSLKVYKRYIYNFQQSDNISDSGLIFFNSEKKINFFQHDNNIIEFNDNPLTSIDDNNGFLNIAFSGKNFIKEYNRKYVKRTH